jgi:hypothetical protein
LPPEAEFDRRTGIHNWADNSYDIGPGQYNFVSVNQFGRKITPREIVPPQQNVTIINQTINVTNITYNNSIVVNHGPSYDELRARSRQPIPRLRLERTNNLNHERPVIRGEVVALPAVDFNPAENATRPNRVARHVGQTTAEHGWSDIPDRQAAEKARAKMKTEATPPPNLPGKRSAQPSPNESATTPANTSPPTQTSTPTPAPTATPTQPAQRNRAELQKEQREQRQQDRNARQAEREQRMREKRGGKKPASQLTPAPSGTPEPSATPEPSPAATPAPSPSASPRRPRPSSTPDESASPSPTESPTASPTQSPTPSHRNPDRLEHKRKHGGPLRTPPGRP